MNNNTGGPAFPNTECFTNNGDILPRSEGMTLRDYFAAKAMASLVMADDVWIRTPIEVVSAAYEMADAMLKERAK